MAIDRTYTFPDGTAVLLRKVSQLVIEHINSSEAGRPPVPEVEVLVNGRHKRKEANPNDPDYRAALAAWQGAKQKRVLLYVCNKGVADDPPDGEAEEFRLYLPPGASSDELKYLWLMSKLTTDEDTTAFVEAVLSQTMPTEASIAESEAVFPGAGESQADQSL